MTALLELSRISQRYGAIEALYGVDLTLRAGEVLGLCGDNGAGKSTLIRIIAGVQPPTTGTIRLAGESVRFLTPRDALEHGIASIYQDLALAFDLAIYQNIFMGSELLRTTLLPGLRLLDKRTMRAQAECFLDQLGVALPSVDVKVSTLSGGQRQAVAISRALRWQAKIIIMDEPTAALGVRETARVLDLIRRLNKKGVSIVLISHNMDDVIAVCQRVIILKKGRKQLERPVMGMTAQQLAHLVMTGDTDIESQSHTHDRV